MCYFVFVAVAPSAVSAAKGLLRSPFHMRASANASVLAMLPPDWALFSLSGEECGCSLYDEPRDPDQLHEADPLETKIARFEAKHRQPQYRKRGWSETKIARAVEQMRTDVHPRVRDPFDGLRNDLKQALGELAAIAGPIFVFAHSFGGDLDAERLVLTRASLPHAAFGDPANALGPDVLCEVR